MRGREPWSPTILPEPGSAGDPSVGSRRSVSIEAEKRVLDNGLQLLIHVDRRLPIVHVNQWFHVGSKNERPGRTGFAHLFEHLMFQGSKNADGEYFRHVEKVGANLREGGVNGTTSNDRTNYFVTAPSGALEYLLWLESDRMTGLLDAMTQEKLDNQRDVVRNERRQNYENRPYGRAWTLIFSHLFDGSHPYSWPVIGSHEDLMAASLDDVKAFFTEHYVPNNLTLTVAGDVDPAEVYRLVSHYFGSVPPGGVRERLKVRPGFLDAPRELTVRETVPQERIYMVWPAIPFFHPDEANLDMAAHVLSHGLTSRLQRALVYDDQVVTHVSASAYALEICGLFLVVATARPGRTLDEVEAIAAREIHRLAQDGPTSEELRRARARVELEFISGLERIGGFGGKADRLAMYNTYLGNPDRFAQDLDRYQGVTPASVAQAVSRYLDNPRRLSLRYVPDTARRSSAPDPDRAQAPALSPDRPFEVPPVTSITLENGLTVFVVERHEIPKVAVRLVLRGGAADEVPGRWGRTLLAFRTLDKGTLRLGALQLEEALEELGTSLGKSGGRETSSVSLEVASWNLGPALALMSEVIREPAFPEGELEREKKRLSDEILQETQDPNGIAGRLIPMLAFGREHSHGHPLTGEPETVSSITREDLVAFHRSSFHASGSCMVFAGDVTLDQAVALAREHFGSWAAGSPNVLEPGELVPYPSRTIYLVDRPDAAQSVVYLLLPGFGRLHPDHHALKLVDAVWGGSFTSRLLMNIREDKGYSYGIYSYPVHYRSIGWWQAGGGVQTQFTRESVHEMLEEIRAIVGSRPITLQELADAKANRIRGYSQSFETLGRLAGHLGTLWSLGLPASELQDEPRIIESITLEQAREVTNRHLVEATISLLVVGDRRKIEPGLGELGLGRIVLLDASGRLL